ncbi:MAG: hypothetical protein KKD44_23290, partial [Proteobacteria bacterium]|nr:hypothetical protein [Pseudomonadota bacterium]
PLRYARNDTAEVKLEFRSIVIVQRQFLSFRARFFVTRNPCSNGQYTTDSLHIMTHSHHGFRVSTALRPE